MAYDIMLQVGMGVDASQLTRTLTNLRSQAAAIGAGFNSNYLIQPLGRITGKANEFTKSLEASNARVIAFGASAGAIYGLRIAFEKLISSTTEVEKSLASINTLLGLGTKDLQIFSNNLFKIANQIGVSFSDAAKAATEFSRQGLGVEETLKRTTAALALSRLSGLGFEEAVSSLTGALNSFVKESLDAEDVVNRLAAVDAKYAVSAGDLSKALSRVGASANDAGVSFNEVVAAVTAAQQVTARGGSVIGNSFKTIFTRLQRPVVLEDLETAGVQVRDLQGKLLPLMSVLKNLSVTYESLGTSQKSFVAEMVGGVYQINILKAIMSDLGNNASIFSGAMLTAENATGSVEARLKVLNETISSQLIRANNELIKSFSNLGNLLLGGTMRSGLESFNSLLQLVSKTTDKSAIQNEGGVLSKFGVGTVQSLLKTFGNILSGPAIQFALFAIFKLFERLQKFVIDSAKDITGLDQKAKDRLSIERAVSEMLAKEKGLFAELVTGQKSVADAGKQFLDILIRQNAALKTRADYTSAITNLVSSKVTAIHPPLAATGFIPNLRDPEQTAAIKAGYQPGATILTHVRMGGPGKTFPVIANTRETKSTIETVDGRQYDYIHPPPGPAYEKHRRASIAKNGIDPNLLIKRPVAEGFIPNFSTENPDLSQSEIFERVKNTTTSGAPHYQAERIYQHPTAKRLLSAGWDFLSSGGESLVFKKGDIVFKVPNNGLSRENLSSKAFASLFAHQVFEKANLPIKVSRVRPAKIERIEGTLQRFSGPTLGNVTSQGKISREMLNYIDNQIGALSSPDRYIGSRFLSVDTASAHNFTVGRPQEFAQIVKNISTRVPKEKISANNQKLMSFLLEQAQLKAIDLNAYANGLIPNLASVRRADVAGHGFVPNLAMGYGEFAPNPLGIKDIFKNPKRFFGQLPFRVAGSLGALGAGAFTQYVEKKPFKAQQFYSAARYLFGRGGVRTIKAPKDFFALNELLGRDLSTKRVGEIFKNFSPQDIIESVAPGIEGSRDRRTDYAFTPIDYLYSGRDVKSVPHFYSYYLTNTIGEYHLGKNKRGHFIQDKFNFDNSLRDVSDNEDEPESVSKAFEETINFTSKKNIGFKAIDFLMRKFGKEQSSESEMVQRPSVKSIKFGPFDFEWQNNLREQHWRKASLNIWGKDLDFAKYGSPFLSRMLLPKIPSVPSSLQQQPGEYDEYSIPFGSSSASGFIPNLSHFLNPKDIEPTGRQFFKNQPAQADALMKSATKKGLLPSDSDGFRQWLGGVILAKTAFPGATPSHADELASLVTKEDIAGKRKERKMAENTILRPEDVQKMLSRRGKEFPLIAAYLSAQNPSAFKNFSSIEDYQAGEFHQFKVPISILHHEKGPALYQNVQKQLKEIGAIVGSSSSLSLPTSTFGGAFGSIFDETMKNFFTERGVLVGSANAALDVLGYHPDIAPFIGTNKPFAGADIKSSVAEGLTKMPSKIFRTLAGHESGKLIGPTAFTPPLVDVGKFNPKLGGIGILDADYFAQKVSTKTHDFSSFLYSALATGKPLQTNIGPMGSGKTTAAQAMGGQFLSSLEQLNDPAIRQLIFTTTSASKIREPSLFSLAAASSANITGFMSSPEILKSRIVQRGRLGENPEAIITQTRMREYQELMEYLQKTFGPLGRFSMNPAAEGLIPNLTKKQRPILGTGYYGTFEKLRSMFRMPIGRKVFGDTVHSLDIEKEWKISKYLEQTQINPLFNFPRVVGSLTKAIQKRSIGKEVMEGSTPYKYTQQDNSFYRTSDIREVFESLAGQQLEQKGVLIDDFIGHSSNTIVNPVAYKYLSKIAQDDRRYEKLMSRLLSKPTLVPQVATALAKKGARLSIIDPGQFEWGRSPREFEGLAQGFIPNLSKPQVDSRAFEWTGEQWGGLPIQDRNQPTAEGLIPNLATPQFINEGAFGRFYKLRPVRNMTVGKKVFKNLERPQFLSSISLAYYREQLQNEWLMSKKLEQTQINPLFRFPKVVGSLNRSIQKGVIGKEVVPGITEENFSSDIQEQTERSRIAILMRHFQKFASQQLESQNIQAYDFVGHSENTIINPEAQVLLSKIAQSSSFEKLERYIRSQPNLLPRIATALAKKGARLSIVDSGSFRMNSAQGLIPNLFFNEAIEALTAENSMTNGRAKLGSHPLLVSPFNPMGLAAIDTQQGTVGNAIQQHLVSQDLPQIKRQRTSAPKGFIPNLAEGDFLSSSFGNSALMAVMMYSSQLSNTSATMGKLNSSFSFLLSNKDKEIRKINDTVQEFEQLRQDLMSFRRSTVAFTGSLVAGAPKKQYSTAVELEEDWGNLQDPQRNVISKYRQILEDNVKAQQNERAKISNTGLKFMLGGAIGGGVLSTVGSAMGSPSVSAGLDTLAAGVTNAGQAMLSFPKQMGKAIGIMFGISAGVKALDIWSKKLESSRASMEQLVSAHQKYITQIDEVGRSINEYSSLITDSATSMRVLNKEASKYFNLLGQLSSSPKKEIRTLATQIQAAPNNESRLRLLQEAKGIAVKDMEEMQMGQFIKEIASKRTVMGANLGSGGIFGYSNELEKGTTVQNVSAISGQIVGSLAPEFKKELMDSVTNLNKFNQIIEKSGNTFFKNTLTGIKEVGGTKQDQNIIVQSVRQNLASQALDKNPEIVASIKALREVLQAHQDSIDNAVQKEQVARRTFINQGAMGAGTEIAVRGLSTRRAHGLASGQLDTMQDLTPFLQAQYGERTIRNYKSLIESKRIDLERSSKETEIKSGFQQSLVSNYSQSMDANFAKNLTKTQAVEGGEGMVTSINEKTQKIIEGINTGLKEVVGKGDVIKQFQGKNSIFDFSSFEQSVAKSSGATPEIQTEIRKFMENNRSLEILTKIQDVNVQIANNTQESVDKQIKNNSELEAFRREINFKELSTYMGGIKNFMDRSSKRSFERDFTRGLSLLERGPTKESRGMGANLLLKSFKEQNIPIDLSGKGALSQLMVKAWNAGVQGVSTSQTGSFNRILNFAQNRGLSKGTIQALMAYKKDTSQTGEAAMKSEFLPENQNIISETAKVSGKNLSEFNTSLTLSTQRVQAFGDFLSHISKSNWQSSLQEVTETKKRAKEATDEAEKQALKTREEVEKRTKKSGASDSPEYRKGWNLAAQVPTIAGLAAGAGLYGMSYLQYRRQGKIFSALKSMEQPSISPVLQTTRQPIPNVSIPSQQPQPRTAKGTFAPKIKTPYPALLMPGGEMVMGGTRIPPIIPAPILAPQASGKFGGILNKAQALAKNPFARSIGRLGGGMALSLLLDKVNPSEEGVTRNLSNQALSLAPYAVSLGGLPALAGTSTAAAGFGLGNKAYQYLNPFGNIGNVNLSSRSRETEKYIQSRLSKGHSIESQTQYIDKLINTEQESRSHLGGWFSKAVSPTAGKQESEINQSIRELQTMRANLVSMKESIDQQTQQSEGLQQFLETINGIKREGQGGEATVNSNIKVEISIRDMEKMPEFIMKNLIDPIKDKLTELQSQVVVLQQQNNLTVSPAAV